ncbi:hypothetical protein DW114_14840 [Absiella sp. AM09-50]|nr:hypothetical protein DW113_13435 [Absiella sp. AM09-45]RGB74122.1 hypothetical protein DW114_14840 [Absiella sp. AM09-50]RGC51850.1 hypothetical protein DW761_09245 [Absiella sp. AM29-15]
MTQLINIAPVLIKIQWRKFIGFIKRRKLVLLFITGLIILLFLSDKFTRIHITLSDDILFIFLLISFQPLFQDIPQVIIHPNLVLLKLIDFKVFKCIYFFKAIIKPVIFIILSSIFLPMFFDIHTASFIMILLIRLSIANHTFLRFQLHHKNTSLSIICIVYLCAYYFHSFFLINTFILIQILYVLLKKQLFYEKIISIYRSILRLQQGFQTDFEGFIKAQETLTKKTYHKHRNYLLENYDHPYFFFKIQYSRFMAEHSLYISESLFSLFLALCFLIFKLYKDILLTAILFLVFHSLSQLLNPIYSKKEQGFYLKLNRKMIFQIFILPSFFVSLPFTLFILMISKNILCVILLQFLLSLSFLMKEKSKIIKCIYVIIMLCLVLILFFQ